MSQPEEERLNILKMIEEGKITTTEGIERLNSLRSPTIKTHSDPLIAAGQRNLRVHITDTATGEVKVAIKVPLKLVQVGMRMGARFIPGDVNIDTATVSQAVREGRTGRILDMHTKDEHVEIFIE